VAERAPELAARALRTVPAVALLAAAAWRAGTLDISGALAGTLLGCTVWGFGGGGAFALLGAFFILGSGATRYGRGEKERRGLAQERGGRRSFRHAFANAGVGAGLALMAAASAAPGPFRLGIAGAFATAAFDTVSSEIGQVRGRRTFSLRGRPVPPGTEGAVSLEGTVAGLTAALGVAALGAALEMYLWSRVGWVAAAAVVGGFVESGLGATLGRRGLLGNESMNFLNTAVGAGLCLAFAFARES